MTQAFVHAVEQARQAARLLVQAAGIQTPPVDLARLAPLVNVHNIAEVHMGGAGLLLPTAEGFRVQVNAADPEARRRFTIAHELGHALLEQRGRAWTAGLTRRQVERLCDLLAAEFLLPENVLSPQVASLPARAQALLHLARRFGTSLQATTLAVLATGYWRVAVVHWRWMPRPGSTEKLRVDWSGVPPTERLFIPRFASAPPDSAPAECHITGWPVTRKERVQVGSLRGEWLADCVPLRDGVLAVYSHPPT